MDLLVEYEKCRNIAREVCEMLCMEHLADKIKVEFNVRYIAKAGLARWRPPERRVIFSIPIWARLSEEKRRNLAVHEVCHIIAREKFGSRIRPHGKEWRNLMILCGEKPSRICEVDTLDLRRKPKRFSLPCNCADGVVIGQHKLTKMRRGFRYKCRVCNVRLDPSTAVRIR